MADPSAPKDLIMLANHITAVKRQVDHYTGELARFTPDHPRYRPDKVVLYRRIVDDLSGVLEYLLERQRRIQARHSETPLQADVGYSPPAPEPMPAPAARPAAAPVKPASNPAPSAHDEDD